MKIKNFLKDERNIKLLEKMDNELKKITKTNNDFSFILPILFVTLEKFRTSQTPFPPFMFQKSKKKTKQNKLWQYLTQKKNKN